MSGLPYSGLHGLRGPRRFGTSRRRSGPVPVAVLGLFLAGWAAQLCALGGMECLPSANTPLPTISDQPLSEEDFSDGTVAEMEQGEPSCHGTARLGGSEAESPAPVSLQPVSPPPLEPQALDCCDAADGLLTPGFLFVPDLEARLEASLNGAVSPSRQGSPAHDRRALPPPDLLAEHCVLII